MFGNGIFSVDTRIGIVSDFEHYVLFDITNITCSFKNTKTG